jgi:16S rRNA (cytidine1402-2'-O)-methyltransferase
MSDNHTIEAALYIVPTPIGNLDDITLRAINILKSVDVIACEDTRHSGKLLKLLGIKNKKLISYHEHNERSRAKQLAEFIEQGQSVAIISDAGTPGISDPAYRIINACIEKKLKIIPLPGPTAFVPALLASGFGTDKFVFYGFPPQKKGRKKFIENLAATDMTSIIYESPFRVKKLIKEMMELGMENRRICIARELTKIYEEFIRGTVAECSEILDKHNNLKGEFVIVIESGKN